MKTVGTFTAEDVRRMRVCHGWAFRDHSEHMQSIIRSYLQGSDAAAELLPEPYRTAHKTEPMPVKRGGVWR